MGEYVVAGLVIAMPLARNSDRGICTSVRFVNDIHPDSALTTRSGMVAILGLPNAGKSSLLNRLLDTKLSIVTPAAQTTRQQVVGIDTRDGVQAIYLDTPGIVRPAYLLHRSMLTIVEKTLDDADVVVLVVDGSMAIPELDGEIAERILGANNLIVGISKADLASGNDVASVRKWIEAHRVGGEFRTVIFSNSTGDGIEELRDAIRAALPISPFFYPEEDISTQSVRFFVSELIRETVFEMYRDEVPYSVAVQIEELRESKDPIFIRATVYVERASQKGIVIGKGGEAIRSLGQSARAKIEDFLQAHVYLDLWIKVLPKWRKNALELERFGFPVPPID